jgi:hypothetical protein
MATVCTLTNLVSWFTCAEQHAYFGELLTIAVFLVFFFQTREPEVYNGLSVSMLIATMVALGLYGIGGVNGAFAVAMIVLLGLTVAARKLL